MDQEIESKTLSVGDPISRIRIGVTTTAKGEVYCDFTIEAEAPTGDNGDLLHQLDVLQADVIERTVRIKRDYEAALAAGTTEEIEF